MLQSGRFTTGLQFSSMFFWIVPDAPTMIGITVTFIFINFVRSLAKPLNLSNFLLPFIFTNWSFAMVRSTWRLLDWNWWSLFFYLKIPENFERIDPFFSMVKLKSLVQFLVHYFSYSILFSFVLLCKFTAFAYYLLNCFIFGSLHITNTYYSPAFCWLEFLPNWFLWRFSRVLLTVF